MSERFFGLLFYAFAKGDEKEAAKIRRALYVVCVSALC